jgi:hypothetical protein
MGNLFFSEKAEISSMEKPPTDSEPVGAAQPPADSKTVVADQPPADSKTVVAGQPPADSKTIGAAQPPTDSEPVGAAQPPNVENCCLLNCCCCGCCYLDYYLIDIIGKHNNQLMTHGCGFCGIFGMAYPYKKEHQLEYCYNYINNENHNPWCPSSPCHYICNWFCNNKNKYTDEDLCCIGCIRYILFTIICSPFLMPFAAINFAINIVHFLLYWEYYILFLNWFC